MSAQGAGARNLGILVMLVAALAAPGLALACSCVWGGPFVKVALRTDLIVLAEVRSYHRHSMEVAVLEVLKGGVLMLTTLPGDRGDGGEAAVRQGVVRVELPSWSGDADRCRSRQPEAADDARYSATPSLCSASVLEKRWRCSSFLTKNR